MEEKLKALIKEYRDKADTYFKLADSCYDDRDRECAQFYYGKFEGTDQLINELEKLLEVK